MTKSLQNSYWNIPIQYFLFTFGRTSYSRRIISIFTLLLLIVQIHGQETYLIDSSRSVSFLSPAISNISTEKYIYNKDNILVRKTQDFGYTQYTYKNNIHKELQYFGNVNNPSLISIKTSIFNDDGFLQLTSYEQIYSGEIRFVRKDSFIRDSEQNVLAHYYYAIDQDHELSLAQLIKQQYLNNNLVEKRTRYIDRETGDTSVFLNISHEYNQANLLLKSSEQIVFSEDSINVTVEYEYQDQELIRSTRITENEYTLIGTQCDYDYSPHGFTVRKFDLSDTGVFLFGTEYYSKSPSEYFEYDTIKVFNNPLGGIRLIREIINTEKVINKNVNLMDSIETRSIGRNFSPTNGSISSFNFVQTFYSIKKSNLPELTLADIFIYPNPSMTGSNIIIQTPNIRYNNVVFHNAQGQQVYRQNVSQSRQTILSPLITNSGIYFVRLQDNDKAVSNWFKIVIQ